MKSNYFKNILNKKIPTVVALMFLMIGLSATVFLVQNSLFFKGRAAPEDSPQNINITNVSDKEFTVSFTTKVKTKAAINIINGEQNQLFYDVKDPQNSKSLELTTHYITVSGLSPETTYKFTILSNTKSYALNGNPYEIATFPSRETSESNSPEIKGVVISENGKPNSDTIVVLKNENISPVSSLTNSKGEYMISPNNLRVKSGMDYYNLTDNEKITLYYYSVNAISRVETIYLIKQDNLPTITLGQDYSFLSDSDNNTEISGDSSFEIPKQTHSKIGQIQIISPKKNESFIDTQPEFRGTAGSSNTVLINILDQNIKEKVVASDNGVWKFRPSKPLTPGAHTLSIQTVDKSGFTKVLSTKFTILPSGSQVAESATPSATLAPTSSPTPSLTSTSTPTLLPISVTTTITQAPTLSPTLALSISPTEIISSPSPTTEILNKPSIPPKSLPPTGNYSQSVIITSASLLLIIAGSFIFFLL